jgi:hypothetical protein
VQQLREYCAYKSTSLRCTFLNKLVKLWYFNRKIYHINRTQQLSFFKQHALWTVIECEPQSNFVLWKIQFSQWIWYFTQIKSSVDHCLDQWDCSYIYYIIINYIYTSACLHRYKKESVTCKWFYNWAVN